MDWTWGWTAIGAIASCILAGSIFVAIWQIGEARRSTNAQIAVELFCELRSEKILETLRYIYSLNPEENLQELTSVEKYNIGYALGRFEILGALVAKRIIAKRLAIETYGGQPAIRCWHQLYKHYIKVEQDKRGYYHDNYEIFTRQSLEHFESEHIRVGFFANYSKIENLVDEFQKGEFRDFRPRNFKEIKRDRRSRVIVETAKNEDKQQV